MVIWGGTWPAGKIASTAAPPEVTIFWRFLLTAAASCPSCSSCGARRRDRPGPPGPTSRASPPCRSAPGCTPSPRRPAWSSTTSCSSRRAPGSRGGRRDRDAHAWRAHHRASSRWSLQRRRPGALAVIGLVAGAGGRPRDPPGLALQPGRSSLRSGNLYSSPRRATWTSVTFFSQRAQDSSALRHAHLRRLRAGRGVRGAVRAGGRQPAAARGGPVVLAAGAVPRRGGHRLRHHGLLPLGVAARQRAGRARSCSSCRPRRCCCRGCCSASGPTPSRWRAARSRSRPCTW